jgi:hypothetical protein
LDPWVHLLRFRGCLLRWRLQESHLDCISLYVVLHRLYISNASVKREDTCSCTLEYVFQFVGKERFLYILVIFGGGVRYL